MRIITLSRQVGSYGDIVAALVARKLGMELVNREKVHEMAQTCDPDYSDACRAYESEHGPGFIERFFFNKPPHTSLFQALTFEEASRGNVILIGRGAQIVLRDVPGVFKLRVVAPHAIRVKRIMERYAIPEGEATDYVRKYDSARRNLVTTVFDVDPSDWALYDMVLNTASIESGAAAKIVVCAVENMTMPPDEEALKTRLKNLALAKRLETVIRKRLSAPAGENIEVVAESGGAIALVGRTRNARDGYEAERIASHYPGVTTVRNELKLTEVSFGY
jgi:cytidylate kinase